MIRNFREYKTTSELMKMFGRSERWRFRHILRYREVAICLAFPFRTWFPDRRESSCWRGTSETGEPLSQKMFQIGRPSPNMGHISSSILMSNADSSKFSACVVGRRNKVIHTPSSCSWRRKSPYCLQKSVKFTSMFSLMKLS